MSVNDNMSDKLDEIELALNLQYDVKTTKCQDPCEPVCRKDCITKPVNKCRRNCGTLLKQRRQQVLRNKADFSNMQNQLASAFKMEIPKYARRPKPTPGLGQGCGSPPRTILPPLWMYSMGTQQPKPTVPAKQLPPKRNNGLKGKNKFRKNYSDEIGTHRYYISS